MVLGESKSPFGWPTAGIPRMNFGRAKPISLIALRGPASYVCFAEQLLTNAGL